MFTANKEGRALLCAIAEGIVPDGAPSPRKVYRFADVAERQTVYPNIEVTPPTGDLDVREADNIGSVLTYWVIASVSSSDPLRLDAECEAYLAALVTAYAYGEGVAGGKPYRYTATAVDTSPPFKNDENSPSIRSVAVQVAVEFHE